MGNGKDNGKDSRVPSSVRFGFHLAKLAHATAMIWNAYPEDTTETSATYSSGSVVKNSG